MEESAQTCLCPFHFWQQVSHSFSLHFLAQIGSTSDLGTQSVSANRSEDLVRPINPHFKTQNSVFSLLVRLNTDWSNFNSDKQFDDGKKYVGKTYPKPGAPKISERNNICRVCFKENKICRGCFKLSPPETDRNSVENENKKNSKSMLLNIRCPTPSFTAFKSPIKGGALMKEGDSYKTWKKRYRCDPVLQL